ncbi:hypothetical protein ACFW88_35505 [Streptomyces anandii]|uniref:Uncharacterized protein n=1 Tax=Streptomyces anandii TaxID=285454 RepID=A0ABW6HGL8_9ACTN
MSVPRRGLTPPSASGAKPPRPEEPFNRFTATWCATSTDCALHGRDATAEYDARVAGILTSRH